MFREVAREPPEPVETLIHRVEAEVVHVDLSESAVELAGPVSLDPCETLWIAGKERNVIHADHDKVWLTEVDDVHPKSKLVQSRHVGDLKAIFDAFHEQWQLRWCKHDGVPFSHWSELVAFAQRVIRPNRLPHLVVDGPLIQAEGARKRRKQPLALMVSVVPIFSQRILPPYRAWPIFTPVRNQMGIGPVNLLRARSIHWPKQPQLRQSVTTDPSQSLDFHIAFGAVSSLDTCCDLQKAGLMKVSMAIAVDAKLQTFGLSCCMRSRMRTPLPLLWLAFR